MAFVLDVNLRIKDIIGLQKAQQALANIQSTPKVGVGKGSGGQAGSVKSLASSFAIQSSAVNANSAAMNKLGLAQEKIKKLQDQVTRSTKKASEGMKSASKSASGFGNSMALAGVRYAAFVAATAVPIAIISVLGKATSAVLEFDTAILKLRQITGQTSQNILGLQNTILDLARSTGTSASELAGVAKVLAQAGQRGEELQASLSALASVPLTPSFETIEAAIEGTIAATQQFKDEALSTADVLDVLTVLSNQFAASSEDIAKGISRGGAAFEAIGGNFQQFASVFTVVRQATRESAETIGTFMKTLSSRLADPKIVGFLEGKNIRIADSIESGNPVAAIKTIAQAINSIPSIQEKVEIGTKLVGRRQISRFLALTNNIDELNRALSIAGNSSGEFGRIAEEGLKGLQAQLNILGQEFNALIQTLAKPLFIPVIKAVTSLGKAFVSIVSFAAPIIPALTAVVAFSAGFSVLAFAINNAAKALALLNRAGLNGNLLDSIRGIGGAGTAGKVAAGNISGLVGTTGIGVKPKKEGLGGKIAGGAGNFAKSQVGQLIIATGIFTALGGLSSSFEESGNVGAATAADILQLGVAAAGLASILSGKSISSVITGLVSSFNPLLLGLTAAGAAIVSFAFISKRIIDTNLQAILDDARRGADSISTTQIASGDTAELSSRVGQLGTLAVTEGIGQSIGEFEDGIKGIFGSSAARLKNLFSGEGLVSISDADARKIIDEIVGQNPEALNAIIASAVQEFGVQSLTNGKFDQIIAEGSGISLDLAVEVRKSIVKALGGLDKLTANLEKIKLEVRLKALSDAARKSEKQFVKLKGPAALSTQLFLLSDAVSKTVKSIDQSVSLFDTLSQSIGQGISVPRAPSNITKESVREQIASGSIGDLANLSGFGDLAKTTKQVINAQAAVKDFITSLISSSAEADSLLNALGKQKISPLEVIRPFAESFAKDANLSPEETKLFLDSATLLAENVKGLLADNLVILPDRAALKDVLDSTLKNESNIADVVVDSLFDLLSGQIKIAEARLKARLNILKVEIDVPSTPKSILKSAEQALSNVGIGVPKDIRRDSGLAGQGGEDARLVQLANQAPVILQELGTNLKDASDNFSKVQKEGIEGQLGGQPEFEQRLSEVELIFADAQAAVEAYKNVVEASVPAFTRVREELDKAGKSTASFSEEAEKRFGKQANETVNTIDLQRSRLQAQQAARAVEITNRPLTSFATQVDASTEALKSFTLALTPERKKQGFSESKVRETKDGKFFTERVRPEIKTNSREAIISKQNLTAATLGGSKENVLEAILKAAEAQAQKIDLLKLSAETTQEATRIASEIKNFRGSLEGAISLVQQSFVGNDKAIKQIAEQAGISLRRDAQAQGDTVDNIGARKEGGLRFQQLFDNLESLIRTPKIIDQPQILKDTLPINILQNLESISPLKQPSLIDRKTDPFNFERVPTTATDIQQSSFDSKSALDSTDLATEGIDASSDKIKTGAITMETASQTMLVASEQLQAVADIRADLAGTPQDVTGGTTSTEGTEAIIQNTEAIRALGEKMNSVSEAVSSQAQQDTESALTDEGQKVEIPGLSENTEAVGANTELAEKTQEIMSGLDEGMTKVASAMEEGIGIDIETASEINVNVQEVADAAKSFTSEFQAVATKVAKEEIRIVLQQLAAASGNSELAQTFESVI